MLWPPVVGNLGVSGWVRDEHGVGLAGIEVRVARSSWRGTRDLGTAVTDADGAFEVLYPQRRRPTLEISLTDVVGRRLDGRRFDAVDAAVLDLAWVVPRAEARGFVVTGGAFGPDDGNDVELLIDNEV